MVYPINRPLQSHDFQCFHWNPHGSNVSTVFEVLKLLKALQFEIAASWASMWRGMLQELTDKDKVREFVQSCLVSASQWLIAAKKMLGNMYGNMAPGQFMQAI